MIKHLFRNQGQFQIRWQCFRNCPPIVFCPQIRKTKDNLSLKKSRAISNLDGNALEFALQLYSALRFERLKIIYLFKNQGQ